MARLRLLDSATVPIGGRNLFDTGDPGAIVAALAQVPELLQPTLAFVGAALGPGAASARHKEIVILRTSSRQRCRFCTDAHTPVALDAGLSPDEVRTLRGEGDAAVDDLFADPAERALVAWVDALASATGPLADDVWGQVRSHWPEHVLVELAVTLGATLFLNRFATGFELPSSPDVVERLAAEGWS
jgi:AhpD family alkylhydroperoxidase